MVILGSFFLSASSSWAQISVPPGFQVEVVALGLNGPEGLGIHGSGQIAVCEAIDVVPGPGFPQSRLALVQRNGRVRHVASDPGSTTWVHVVTDPLRGYFVSALGSIPRGVKLVSFDGQVTQFSSPLIHFTGIALDPRPAICMRPILMASPPSTAFGQTGA